MSTRPAKKKKKTPSPSLRLFRSLRGSLHGAVGDPTEPLGSPSGSGAAGPRRRSASRPPSRGLLCGAVLPETMKSTIELRSNSSARSAVRGAAAGRVLGMVFGERFDGHHRGVYAIQLGDRSERCQPSTELAAEFWAPAPCIHRIRFRTEPQKNLDPNMAPKPVALYLRFGTRTDP